MTLTPSIRLEMQDGLAIVSLAQPARGNPFDGDFTRDFRTVFS
jgi:2-(1,2-epoxy-1,2-dihydrophenyl)acetyl-CoA isomerase